MGKFTDIILHIPHSSCRMEKMDYEKWDGNIESCINRLTDWHTDVLFASEDCRVHPLVFGYSRFYCDVERLLDDPMELIGQGIAYSNFDNCRRVLTEDERDRIYAIYDSWHKRLDDECNKYEKPLIVDCHSFPSDIGADIDVCIGFNDDWSHPSDELLNLVFDLFEKRGYSVAFNKPYSNSMTPCQECACKSIMLEINKRVYLQEDEISVSEHLVNFNKLLNELYCKILD